MERISTVRPAPPAPEPLQRRIVAAPPAPAHVALPHRLAALHGGSGVVQRTAAWKDDNHRDKALDGFAAALDGFVQKAAQVALESPEALAGVDGYTTLWQDTALLLMADRDGLVEDDQAAEVAVAKSFGAARYGYAIESHACAQALGGALPDGYAYQLQASRGMTRPDIVVFDDSKAEVGWFDITSEGSLGHIDLKTGSSWKTKPYVAEFTYPPLDVSHLGTGKLSIGEKVKIRNAVRRRKKNWQDFVNTKCASFLGRWKYNGGPTDTAKSTKKSTARFSLETVFPGLAATDSVATSLLRAFGLTVSQFGYSSGGSKATGEAILRDYEDV